MITIKRAQKKDYKSIHDLLKELDLLYPGQNFDNFWVAANGSSIIGTVSLQEHENYTFLDSLGIQPEFQNHGIARLLLNRVLELPQKDIYLYTIIPDFFRKFGFKNTPSLPNLPTKDQYECEYCHPDKCVCMVKYTHAT